VIKNINDKFEIREQYLDRLVHAITNELSIITDSPEYKNVKNIYTMKLENVYNSYTDKEYFDMNLKTMNGGDLNIDILIEKLSMSVKNYTNELIDRYNTYDKIMLLNETLKKILVNKIKILKNIIKISKVDNSNKFYKSLLNYSYIYNTLIQINSKDISNPKDISNFSRFIKKFNGKEIVDEKILIQTYDKKCMEYKDKTGQCANNDININSRFKIDDDNINCMSSLVCKNEGSKCVTNIKNYNKYTGKWNNIDKMNNVYLMDDYCNLPSAAILNKKDNDLNESYRNKLPIVKMLKNNKKKNIVIDKISSIDTLYLEIIKRLVEMIKMDKFNPMDKSDKNTTSIILSLMTKDLVYKIMNSDDFYIKSNALNNITICIQSKYEMLSNIKWIFEENYYFKNEKNKKLLYQVLINELGIRPSYKNKEDVLIYRGVNYTTDMKSIKKKKVPENDMDSVIDSVNLGNTYSLSFNTSILNGFFYDVSACTYWYFLLPNNTFPFKYNYTMKKHIYGDETDESKLFFVPPIHPFLQLYCTGELWHMRTKIAKDHKDINTVGGIANGLDSPLDYLMSSVDLNSLNKIYVDFIDRNKHKIIDNKLNDKINYTNKYYQDINYTNKYHHDINYTNKYQKDINYTNKYHKYKQKYNLLKEKAFEKKPLKKSL